VSAPPGGAGACNALLALAAVQVGLGAATVVLGVPTAIAVLHQAGGVALLTGCLVAGHGLLSPGRVMA
jgi:heme A synthase